MEYHENGSTPHHASCSTVMKHDGSETKTLSDLDAMKVAKGYLLQELNHQMYQCNKLVTLSVIEYELWNHNLIMIKH